MERLDTFLAHARRDVDTTLDAIIPRPDVEPTKLHEAIRWSAFAGGKRIRPALVYAAGRTFSVEMSRLSRTAAAVEMIHTYSLIHDDLPAMDNDDLRRGRDTCHKKFGEATAILAGDALQAMAFQVISEDTNLSGEVRLVLIEQLARATLTMISGQQLDLEAEGEILSLDEIRNIHVGKTGALIRFSATAGAIIAGAPEKQIMAISNFGENLGLLFQITDDLLDITQTSNELGKTAGKDMKAEKATYPAILGVEQTRKLAATVHSKAVAELYEIDRPGDMLHAIAKFILARKL